MPRGVTPELTQHMTARSLADGICPLHTQPLGRFTLVCTRAPRFRTLPHLLTLRVSHDGLSM